MTEKSKGLLIFSLFLALLYWLHYSQLNAPLGLDDDTLIFSNDLILQKASPHLYWTRGHPFTRAWPLTHTVYWTLFQFFEFQLWLYRIFCIFLLWLVSISSVYFFQRNNEIQPMGFFVGLFVCFHPISYELVTWVTQISTLLSAFFIILWLKNIETFRASKFVTSHLLYFLAIASKGYAFLFPPYELFYRRKSLPAWRLIAVMLFPITMSLYFMFLTSIGTYKSDIERHHGVAFNKPTPSKSTNALFSANSSKERQSKFEAKKNKELISHTESNRGYTTANSSSTPPNYALHEPKTFFGSESLAFGVDYILDSLLPTVENEGADFILFWATKINRLGLTFSYYTNRAFFPYYSKVKSIYDSSEKNLATGNILLGLLFIVLSILAFFQDRLILMIAVLTYIPISGMFYITYMKHDLVSDHYVYVSYCLCCILLGRFLQKRIRLFRPYYQ